MARPQRSMPKSLRQVSPACIILLLPLLASRSVAQSATPSSVRNYSQVNGGKAYAFRDGATILRVLLPFHLEFNSTTRLCSRFNSRMALQFVEAVRLAADIVQNSSLLGNMSVGFKILDTCSNVFHVMELPDLNFAVPGLTKVCQQFCLKRRDQVRRIRTRNSGVANLVVGIGNSDILRASVALFNSFKVPLISHAASIFAHNSVKGFRRNQSSESFVLQVGPDERLEAELIVDIADKFNRSHVAIFSPRKRQPMYSLLVKEFGQMKPDCLYDLTGRDSLDDSESIFDAAEKINRHPFIKAVVLLGDLESSLPFIRAVSYLNAINNMVWIMTSAWGKQVWGLSLNDPEYQVVAEMSHVFFPQPVPAERDGVQTSWEMIENRLQDRLQNANHLPQENNPLFIPEWEVLTENVPVDNKAKDHQPKCSHSNQPAAFSAERGKACSLKAHHFPLHDSLFLMDAFFAAANVLERVYKRARKNACRKNDKNRMSSMCLLIDQVRATPSGWFHLSHKEKKSVTSSVGLDSKSIAKNFVFASTRGNKSSSNSRNVNIKYKILYTTPSKIQSASLPLLPLTLAYWTPEGGFSDTFRQSPGFADTIASLSPLIHRAHVCPPGTFQNQECSKKDKKCCWKACLQCQGQTYTDTTDAFSCQNCSYDESPNAAHTSCEPIWKFNHAASMSAVTMATLGLVMTTVTIVLFWRNHKSFIVKTSDFTLSMGMLIFHAASFISTPLLLVKPSRFICPTQVLLVLPWPLLYVGCILIKINRLRMLFRQVAKLSRKERRLLNNKAQLTFLVVVGLQIAIFLAVWVAISSPRPLRKSFEGIVDLTCNLNETWMGVYFGGTLSLLIISFILALSSRKVPADFSEAFSLVVSSALITSLWIILIPAYYVSTSVRPSNLLALIITSQGLTTYCLLFGRRVYYILRPLSEEELKARKMIGTSSSSAKKESSVSGSAPSVQSATKAAQWRLPTMMIMHHQLWKPGLVWRCLTLAQTGFCQTCVALTKRADCASIPSCFFFFLHNHDECFSVMEH